MLYIEQSKYFAVFQKFGWLLIFGLIVWFFLPVFEKTLPGGIDTPSHLFKIWFLSNNLEGGLLSSYTNYWYLGTDLFKFYPPLSYLPPVILIVLGSDLFTAYNLTFLFFILLTPLSLYLFCRELEFSRFSSYFSTLFFVFGYQFISSILPFGRYPNFVALPFALMGFRYLLKSFDNFTARNTLLSIGFLSLTVYIHHLTTYLLALSMGVYIIVKVLKTKSFDCLIPLSAIAFGTFAITSPWLIPALMDISEFSHVKPYLGSWWNLNIPIFLETIIKRNFVFSHPSYLSAFQIVLGIFGIYSALKSRTVRDLFLVSWFLIFFLLSLGAPGELLRFIPFAQDMDISRFLVIATIPLSMLAALKLEELLGGLEHKYVAVAVVIVVFLSIYDILPARYDFISWELPKESLELMDWLKTEAEQGPVITLGFGTWDSFAFPYYANRSILGGWYHEGSKIPIPKPEGIGDYPLLDNATYIIGTDSVKQYLVNFTCTNMFNVSICKT